MERIAVQDFETETFARLAFHVEPMDVDVGQARILGLERPLDGVHGLISPGGFGITELRATSQMLFFHVKLQDGLFQNFGRGQRRGLKFSKLNFTKYSFAENF